MARGERYVGTRGGGMDQTTSLFGEPHHALFIEFFPIRIQKVPLPGDFRVVVCNSLVTAEKSAAKREFYNQRVMECHLGVAMINRFLMGDQASSSRKGQNLEFLDPASFSSKRPKSISAEPTAKEIRSIGRLGGFKSGKHRTSP